MVARKRSRNEERLARRGRWLGSEAVEGIAASKVEEEVETGGWLARGGGEGKGH